MSHNYTPPYPVGVLEFAGAMADSPSRPGREYDERHFLLRDNDGYWLRNENGQPDSSSEGRNAGGIWTGNECRYWNIGTHGVMELLPLQVIAQVEELEKDIDDITKQVDDLLAEKEPKEISLPPGQILFSLLKGGEVRAIAGNPNYKDKAAILKYMAAQLKNQSEYWENEIAAGRLPDSMSIAVLALIIQGDTDLVKGDEYSRLSILVNTCRDRLVAMCQKPQQPLQAKIGGAIKRTLEGY